MFDPRGGKTRRYPKFGSMPRDLATILRMKAARSHRADDHRCSGCHRVPLAGELMLVSDRPLAVVPRAA
jgi:hypothetical protein